MHFIFLKLSCKSVAVQRTKEELLLERGGKCVLHQVPVSVPAFLICHSENAV